MKIERKHVTEAALYLTLAAASVSVVLYIGRIAERARAQNSAAWDTWESDMRRAGCKVTGFTSEKQTTYPIWHCPDGTAHLGRAR